MVIEDSKGKIIIRSIIAVKIVIVAVATIETAAGIEALTIVSRSVIIIVEGRIE